MLLLHAHMCQFFFFFVFFPPPFFMCVVVFTFCLTGKPDARVCELRLRLPYWPSSHPLLRLPFFFPAVYDLSLPVLAETNKQKSAPAAVFSSFLQLVCVSRLSFQPPTFPPSRRIASITYISLAKKKKVDTFFFRQRVVASSKKKKSSQIFFSHQEAVKRKRCDVLSCNSLFFFSEPGAFFCLAFSDSKCNADCARVSRLV